MSNVNLDVYLFFQGKCAEAMEFYKSIFGGEITLQKFDDVPGMVEKQPELKGKLVHAALRGGEITLMASDSSKPDPEGRQKVSLTLGGTDEARLTEVFTELSAGGSNIDPLQKQFWGDIFGAFTDKYGVNWMINIEAKKE